MAAEMAAEMAADILVPVPRQSTRAARTPRAAAPRGATGAGAAPETPLQVSRPDGAGPVGSVGLEEPRFRLLSQQIAHTLRRAILQGRYGPGGRLVEAEVANALNVSRAPVRDALRQLVQEGLVTVFPHRGGVVTPVSEEMVHDVFDIRARLEGLAARLAATRITDEALARAERLIAGMKEAADAGEPGVQTEQDIEFHRIILEASGRPALIKTMAVVSGKTALLIGITRRHAPLDVVPRIHKPIVSALRSRDPDKAEEAARAHVEYGRGVLLRYFPEEHRDR
jgi:DNA-binding GntR family transcriptional regulator